MCPRCVLEQTNIINRDTCGDRRGIDSFCFSGSDVFLITFAVYCDIYVAAPVVFGIFLLRALSLPRSLFHIFLAVSANSSLPHIPFTYLLRTSIPLTMA